MNSYVIDSEHMLLNGNIKNTFKHIEEYLKMIDCECCRSLTSQSFVSFGLCVHVVPSLQHDEAGKQKNWKKKHQNQL